MPKTQTIRCINKDDRYNPYEAITHVGGTNPDGGRWRITQEHAIQQIEAEEWQYFVEVERNRVRVVVAESRYGNNYLKTEPDEDLPNNLLSLPECPR